MGAWNTAVNTDGYLQIHLYSYSLCVCAFSFFYTCTHRQTDTQTETHTTNTKYHIVKNTPLKISFLHSKNSNNLPCKRTSFNLKSHLIAILKAIYTIQKNRHCPFNDNNENFWTQTLEIIQTEMSIIVR